MAPCRIAALRKVFRMATVWEAAVCSKPSSSSSSSSLLEPLQPGWHSRGSMTSPVFDDEVVEESIEFEEEEEVFPQHHASPPRTAAPHNAASRIRNARIPLERCARRAPPSSSHGLAAQHGGSLSLSNTWGASGTAGCHTSACSTPLSCGRGWNAAPSSHAEPLSDPPHHERHGRSLLVKGINPLRGLSKLSDSPSHGLAKLPDSPVHVKKALPTRLALSSVGDADDWRTDDSTSLPGSAVHPEHDLSAPWHHHDGESSMRSSPAMAVHDDQQREAQAARHVPSRAADAPLASAAPAAAQGPWKLPQWVPMGERAEAEAELTLPPSIGGRVHSPVRRSRDFLEDEVEEDIDEDELLHAFDSSSRGSTPALMNRGAAAADAARSTPGAWEENWLKLSEGVVGVACSIAAANAAPSVQHGVSEHLPSDASGEYSDLGSAALSLTAPPSLLRAQLGLGAEPPPHAAPPRSRERAGRSESPALCHPPHPPFCTAPSSHMSACSEQDDELWNAPVETGRDAAVCEAQALMRACAAAHGGAAPHSVGTSLAVGPRPYMEDFVALQPLHTSCGGEAPLPYLAVFDGHNGECTAKAARSLLHLLLRSELDTALGGAEVGKEALSSALASALYDTFGKFDRWIKKTSRWTPQPISRGSTSHGTKESTLPSTSEETSPWRADDHEEVDGETSGDEEAQPPSTHEADGDTGDEEAALLDEILQEWDEGRDSIYDRGLAEQGSTALVCVIAAGRLHLASVGDSRAVLKRGSDPCLRITTDHSPKLPAERERILALGGMVSRGRVHGILAVSRALGDLELQPFVSPEPEVSIMNVGSDDCVLVMGSDGVWGIMSDEDVLAVACEQPDAQRAADAIMAAIESKGGRDNASVIVAMWRSAT